MSDIIKGQFSAAIAMGETPLADMLARIDEYYIMGRLTSEEKETLYAEAREQAAGNYAETLDFAAKLQELELRVKALEDAQNAGGDEPGEEPKEETPPEYEPGKWYYAGDKVTFEGKQYQCVAPTGVVCVWSPTEYPAYWEML